MARKSKKRPSRVKGETRTFSLVALHGAFDDVERRLKAYPPTKEVKQLLRDIRECRKMFDCGSSMEIELPQA